MAKLKKTRLKRTRPEKPKPKTPPRKMVVYTAEPGPAAPEDPIAAGNLSLHELFAGQTTAMLDRADISDEQKQSILIAMSCPCCGAGGFSFTAKLKR
jgi:hypothetical protein